MKKLRVLDLFSGIGGFSLGLERTGGFETVAFCEIEEFPRRVLKKHWPEVPCYHDVRELTAETLRRDGIAVDVIAGGFPCQDVSSSGQQRGMDGTRSGLWSEIVRLTSEIKPRFVAVENVSNLLAGERGAWFGRVLRDLAEIGYNAEWHCIPASYVGLPHSRDRIWIIAYPECFDGYAWTRVSKSFVRRSINKALARGGQIRFNYFPQWANFSAPQAATLSEMTMGFPMGWTDLKAAETPSSPKSQNS